MRKSRPGTTAAVASIGDQMEEGKREADGRAERSLRNVEVQEELRRHHHNRPTNRSEELVGDPRPGPARCTALVGFNVSVGDAANVPPLADVRLFRFASIERLKWDNSALLDQIDPAALLADPAKAYFDWQVALRPPRVNVASRPLIQNSTSPLA